MSYIYEVHIDQPIDAMRLDEANAAWELEAAKEDLQQGINEGGELGPFWWPEERREML